MKKMAMISSYAESCGNAAFTKILHDSIEAYNEEISVDIIELDLKLLQSISSSVRKKADIHINNICKKLREYDCVNIQMEAGLYGTLPSDIINRFKKLVSSNKNTSVTLHSPRLLSSTQSSSRAAIKKILTLNVISGIKELIADKYSQIHVTINKKIIKLAMQNNARLIVHTLRAQKQIKDFFSYERVDVHPLKMIPINYSYNNQTFLKIREEMQLDDKDVLIGMFGYISAYKGHTDALNALKLLPKNHKLMIFGRQHPQTLKADGSVDGYLNHLVHIVTTDKKLKGRVFFMGELNDQDFLDVASSIDISWLPYYENGQDGSGIASICLDRSPRVLCSSSFAFDELFKQVKYKNVLRFDIGNTAEMASKTLAMMRKPLEEAPFCNEELYNLKTQSDVYVKGL